MLSRVPPLFLLLFTLGACSDSSTEAPSAAGELKTVAPPATGMVELTAAGVKIEPPAKKDQIPDGAWYCDMGSVHFAATEEGDGKCDICRMDLVHKGGEGGH